MCFSPQEPKLINFLGASQQLLIYFFNPMRHLALSGDILNWRCCWRQRREGMPLNSLHSDVSHHTQKRPSPEQRSQRHRGSAALSAQPSARSPSANVFLPTWTHETLAPNAGLHANNAPQTLGEPETHTLLLEASQGLGSHVLAIAWEEESHWRRKR